MAAVPAGLDTERGPPLTIPLRHFLVGLGFLLAGIAVGLAQSLGLAPTGVRLAHVHLLLVGWICCTILGAMAQFVPVWSGVELHSRRLANLQLVLVSGGLTGLATTLVLGETTLQAVGGGILAVGFWTFVYTVGRTLLRARPWDVTERHFAFALACFAVVPALGLALVVDRATPFLGATLPGVLGAHATLAVFGAILATVCGALHQLATMFTQTDLDGIDRHLRRFESVGYPLGVVALAGGRLLGDPLLARAGAVLVVAGLLAMGTILARRLAAARVQRTPTLTRYALVVPALAAWAILTLPAWLGDPLARTTLLGPPGGHLLVVGVVGFVVLGSLYHVLPFVVWIHRYSDRLGFEPVPMLDDLYDDRLALVDLVCVTAGTVGLVVGSTFDVSTTVTAGSGTLLAGGFCLVAANLGQTVARHAPAGFARKLLGLAVSSGSGK